MSQRFYTEARENENDLTDLEVLYVNEETKDYGGFKLAIDKDAKVFAKDVCDFIVWANGRIN